MILRKIYLAATMRIGKLALLEPANGTKTKIRLWQRKTGDLFIPITCNYKGLQFILGNLDNLRRGPWRIEADDHGNLNKGNGYLTIKVGNSFDRAKENPWPLLRSSRYNEENKPKTGAAPSFISDCSPLSESAGLGTERGVVVFLAYVTAFFA